MKQINLKQKSLLFMLVMLCLNLSAVAETVEIDGIFYNLQSGWNYGCPDATGNWNSQWYNNVAFATNIDVLGSKVQLQDGVFNLKGQKVAGNSSDLQKLPKGVYIINGEKVVK